jgi:hypothetical protein
MGGKPRDFAAEPSEVAVGATLPDRLGGRRTLVLALGQGLAVPALGLLALAAGGVAASSLVALRPRADRKFK